MVGESQSCMVLKSVRHQADVTTLATSFKQVDDWKQPSLRVNVPLPIVLPITDYTKALIEASGEVGAKAGACTDNPTCAH